MIKKGQMGTTIFKDGMGIWLKPFNGLRVSVKDDHEEDAKMISVHVIPTYESMYAPSEFFEWDQDQIIEMNEGLFSQTEVTGRYNKATECMELRSPAFKFEDDAKELEISICGLLEWIKENHNELFLKAVHGDVCLTEYVDGVEVTYSLPPLSAEPEKPEVQFTENDNVFNSN